MEHMCLFLKKHKCCKKKSKINFSKSTLLPANIHFVESQHSILCQGDCEVSQIFYGSRDSDIM